MTDEDFDRLLDQFPPTMTLVELAEMIAAILDKYKVPPKDVDYLLRRLLDVLLDPEYLEMTKRKLH